jgi:hypothetical protein
MPPYTFTLDHCSAIITGASSGLGAEFARQLAPTAKALMLVARREDALKERMAELLQMRPGLAVHLCVADVATDEGRARVLECLRATQMQPNLLINNAGMGDYGAFSVADPAKVRAQVDLNITALLMLTHSVLPLLQTPAGILNVSSLAGNVPMPDVAVYAATKAFVTSFTEALRVELADKDIVVSALCPGPTPTNFSKTAKRDDGTDTDRSGQGALRVLPQIVVAEGLAALTNNKASVFPGLGVKVTATLVRIMPRPVMRWLITRRHRAAHARQSSPLGKS